MTKEFQKAICARIRLKNKMNKNPGLKNITGYNLSLTTLQQGALLQVKTFNLSSGK